MSAGGDGTAKEMRGEVGKRVKYHLVVASRAKPLELSIRDSYHGTLM
jgi:hypothetical protein